MLKVVVDEFMILVLGVTLPYCRLLPGPWKSPLDGALPRVVYKYCPAMAVAREGGCSCGAVRYRLTSEPMFVHCCHCLNCQRQTGSAFVINLLLEAERMELLAGEPQPVDVPRDDGNPQRIYRCPTCQVAVYSEYGRPEVRFVRAGTLDEPSS